MAGGDAFSWPCKLVIMGSKWQQVGLPLSCSSPPSTPTLALLRHSHVCPNQRVSLAIPVSVRGQQHTEPMLLQ